PPPKSTGRALFHLEWLKPKLADGAPAEDIQATLSAFTASSIASALQNWAPKTQRLLVCGGGAHNRHLLNTLSGYLPDICVEPTSAQGMHPDWIEAAAFAWMARETLAARPSNVPSVTGARHPVILGGTYSAGTVPE
ncbi:MAG: anhydro-N-acetylmuramic acid kinase, partial [Gammaproteobacteria bacterium]|nr:anhydro-N-acetylmuramic acid kinase [Gammaproteobacteria bacterium]